MEEAVGSTPAQSSLVDTTALQGSMAITSPPPPAVIGHASAPLQPLPVDLGVERELLLPAADRGLGRSRFLCVMTGTDVPGARNQAACQRPGGSGISGMVRRPA